MAGPLDYYRQFQGLSEEEVNAQLRSQASERRHQALARLAPLDLSHTTWPHLPHPNVVNAVTYVARRGLHRYLDPRASALRDELAHRLGIAPERVVVGNGAAQLLGAAAQALIEPGQELICPWPTYPLLPAMARRARGRAVAVAGFSIDALAAAVNPRTRVVAIASPNDPTGERLPGGALRSLLEDLPEQVIVLLDEALVEFADAGQAEASLAVLEDHPRLVLFRSFSKAWGLAGLRCGYAVGGPGSAPLLERIEPELGVNELAQAGALEAVRSCSALVAERALAVAAERQRLSEAIAGLGLEVSDSQANFLWVGKPGLDGTELARRLERSAILVAPGASLGDASRVRAAVAEAPAGDRLLVALRGAADGQS